MTKPVFRFHYRIACGVLFFAGTLGFAQVPPATPPPTGANPPAAAEPEAEDETPAPPGQPAHLEAAAALAPDMAALETRAPLANTAIPLGGANLNRLRGGLNRNRTDLEAAYRACVDRVRFATDAPSTPVGADSNREDYMNPTVAANCSRPTSPEELAIRFNQAESFQQFGNDLEVCAVDSVDGKDDDDCAEDPGAPGCVGASGALHNVVTAEAVPPGCNPDIPPCEFVKDGIPATVWLGAAENHLVGGNHCIDRRLVQTSGDDSAIGREMQLATIAPDGYAFTPIAAPRLEASPDRRGPHAELISARVSGSPNPSVISAENTASGASRAGVSPLAAAPAGSAPAKSGPNSGASTESGETYASVHERFLALFDAEKKFVGDDGSKHFGLESGELLRRVGKGEKLRDILRDSPVAKKFSERELVGRLGDPEAGEVKDPRAQSRVALARPAKNRVEKSGEEISTAAASASAGANPGDASPSALASNAAPERTPAAANASPASLYQELTIFERASRQYKSRAPDMLTIDFHLRSIAPKGSGVAPGSPFKVE